MLSLIQLIMAIGSQNNLIYLFVFSEISIALSSMFFTNSNILKTRLKKMKCSTAFAGEETWVQVQLFNGKKIPPQNLQVSWTKAQTDFKFPLDSFLETFLENLQFSLPWIPKRRGLQSYPRLRIQSTFPFGLLRAWKVLQTEGELLVFPKRQGSPVFPISASLQSAQENAGLFFDLRVFAPGDSPRRIDWKASLRTQQFLIRRFEQEGTPRLNFIWQQTEKLPLFEDRVSQLALWVDLAERESAVYSLCIGSWQSKQSSGPSHWKDCLEYLALLEETKLNGI